ncbi:MAG: phosphatidylinositol-3-phosphate phosphatase [Marmoricola sp.]|nr:phosphatidylinositol-3-phosphate phosphatase [Marmoricola sp.]
MRLGEAAAGIAVVLAVAGCGVNTRTPAASLTGDGTPSRATVTRALPTKVLVVIEENHSLAQMRSGMPYLAGLSDRYGYATDWSALRHPSEPNYLAIAGGSTFGVTDDAPPATNAVKVGNAGSVFSQARRHGRSYATYAESMPSRCALVNSGEYAVRHNPWTYFGADRTACRAHDVSLTPFAGAARNDNLPNVAFLIPNLVHDAHDASLGAADQWLRTHLAPVLASADFTSGRLVVIVTADEDDRHSHNTVLTSVLSARLHHRVVRTALNHYSLTRFIAQVLRAKPLKAGRTAPDLRTAFGL